MFQRRNPGAAAAIICLVLMSPGLAEDDAGEAARAPLNYVPLDPPFVVNFGAGSDVRFLQVSLQAATRSLEAVDLIKEHRPARCR